MLTESKQQLFGIHSERRTRELRASAATEVRIPPVEAGLYDRKSLSISTSISVGLRSHTDKSLHIEEYCVKFTIFRAGM